MVLANAVRNIWFVGTAASLDRDSAQMRETLGLVTEGYHVLHQTWTLQLHEFSEADSY